MQDEPQRVAKPELMAPAGGPDAAYAALYHGADAVYLGLRRFSARADAENFDPAALEEVIGYAHALEPRRRVYVTLNTLMLDREVPSMIEQLALVDDLEADAVIVQDLGVYRLARHHFPRLRLHASTQMAVVDRCGVEALRTLGFARATLARELTLDEIRAMAALPGIEVEAFVHGALCYSYSGLCLYSAMTTGRSGNRGRCAYSCRDRFAPEGGEGGGGFLCSMKDLALPDAVGPLAAAGVKSLKIEGRKKSALYVAAVVRLYRGLIDGTLSAAARRALEEDLHTIFSRPWTTLFAVDRDNRDLVDAAVVGHRGLAIGRVGRVVRRGSARRLAFVATRPVERHDGLQIDLPGRDRPYGFPVDRLFLAAVGRAEPREIYEAPAGVEVEVELPPDHPRIPEGAVLYWASSQAVKRRYPFDRPRPGQYRVRRSAEVRVILASDRMRAEAHLVPRGVGEDALSAGVELSGSFTPARNPGGVAASVRGAFERLGDTRLDLAALDVENSGGLFAPVSQLNALRRALATELEATWEHDRRRRIDAACRAWSSSTSATCAPAPRPEAAPWILRTDQPEILTAFEADDWRGVREVVLDIGLAATRDILEGAARAAGVLGPDGVRMAWPMIARGEDAARLQALADRLVASGWKHWEISGLSGWSRFSKAGCDLTADWPLYVLNREALRAAADLGVRRVTASPEDSLDNLRALAGAEELETACLVYQDTPLFIAKTCACADLNTPACPGPSHCRRADTAMVSASGDHVLFLRRAGRTVVIGRDPYCLAGRLEDLAAAGVSLWRIDFVWRRYTPQEAVARWRAVRHGDAAFACTGGNLERGLL